MHRAEKGIKTLTRCIQVRTNYVYDCFSHQHIIPCGCDESPGTGDSMIQTATKSKIAMLMFDVAN
eukprot:scaffold64399_cov49-Prasinocladus_malaysianus.AAC.1